MTAKTEPAPPHPILTHETPVFDRHTARAIFQVETPDEKKKDVHDDVSPSARIVTTTHFLRHILPPLPAGIDLDAVVKVLKKKRIITKGRFKFFSEDPKISESVEDTVFKNMEKLVYAIVSAATPNEDQLDVQFECSPNITPLSHNRINRSRPDCFIRLRSNKRAEWNSIAVSGEFKKSDGKTKVDDNWLKALWSMYHCMCEDPRRRFTFSFTVENTEMRLWFCSREQLILSNAFDFVEDHVTTVRIFLSFMFAPLDDLGWDPTMERVEDGQFDITVHSSPQQILRYRTVRLLSDKGADVLFGRATRVWEVRLLDGDQVTGPPVVLKDLWIDRDRTREGEIYEELRKTEGTHPFLFAAITYGDVYIQRSTGTAVLDDTTDLAMRGAPIPRGAPTLALHEIYTLSRLKRTLQSAGSYINGYRPLPSPILLHPKVHTRLVLNELWTPLHTEIRLEAVYRVLSLACDALHTLHALGWVHRDLTPSNIFMRKTTSGLEVKLADLEYAKKMTEQSVHAARSGSCEFRAVEAMQRDFNYRADIGSVFGKFLAAAGSILPALPFIKSSKSNDKVPFRYNPLHDLESLWWIACYFVISKGPHEGDVVHDITLQQVQQYEALFYKEDTIVARKDLIDKDHTMRELRATVHSSVQGVLDSLNELRSSLGLAYMFAECDCAAIDHTVADDLVKKFAETFGRIADNLKESDLTVHPFDSDIQFKNVEIVPSEETQAEEDAAKIQPAATAQRASRKRKLPRTPTDGSARSNRLNKVLRVSGKPKTLLKQVVSNISGPAARTRSRMPRH